MTSEDIIEHQSYFVFVYSEDSLLDAVYGGGGALCHNVADCQNSKIHAAVFQTCVVITI